MNEQSIYDFRKDFAFSVGNRERIDCEMIMQAIPNCESVIKTDEQTDKKGIDYIATLQGGAKINIDAKARRKGVQKVNGYPVLAIETWSVMKSNQRPDGKIGWTYSQESDVDMILYTFDKEDYDKFFLLPFQHLRMASIKNYYQWKERYGLKKQQNRSWCSQCMFVPANIVLKAVFNQMIHETSAGEE